MTSAIAQQLVPLADLKPYPGNAKRHDIDLIRRSLRRHGQYRLAVVQTSTGHVLIGNGMLEAARLEGWAELAVTYKDCDDDTARELVLLDNRSGELGGYDEAALAELLSAAPTLIHTGYDDDDLASLLASVNSGAHGDARSNEVSRGRAMNGEKRKLPLDVVLSLNAGPSHAEAQAGLRMGWQPGIISTSVGVWRLYRERYPQASRLAFMDNEWHGYDHDKHLAAVAEATPRYATTRDIMTKDQCREAGVDFYSLPQVLAMAEQVAEHVDNVILIPKWDCLDELPRTIGNARVVLGYSVESSYGGTPLPIETFRGWPIHLLGGPWDKQRAYLNLMGDDVVSFDNNHLMRIAQFGQVCMRDGSTSTLDDVLGYKSTAGHFFPAFVLSLAAIATEVREVYGVDMPELNHNEEAGDT